ncbi:hypothetical protein BDV93DRAFT_75514 [Ceratobasidium sp. AG-I]|nr:hypothetical protein BDV93DRAFT_75514 [Ceratobasidium sp. AG-I]
MGPPAEDPELIYYVSVVFPVLHELAGFNLSSQELLILAQRDKAVSNVLRAQAKHHQNRMRFLTSAEDPQHPVTQQLCLDLAATNNAHVTALAALGPSFEHATRHNETNTLAALYTLLHFGGLGDLIARHNSSRRSGHVAPAGTGFLLEMSCQWLAGAIALSNDLASALRRGGDRQRAIIQAAIHIDIFSSISLCRPPHFLDAYRSSFKHSDILTSTDKNGVRVAVEPRLDDLLDIPAKTLLALAETAAMASWKSEHVRQGSLSVMDLSRWAKRIDALLAPPLAETIVPPTPIPSATATRVPTTPSHTQMLPVIAPVVPVMNASPSPSHAPGKANRTASVIPDASAIVAQPSSHVSGPVVTESPSVNGAPHVGPNNDTSAAGPNASTLDVHVTSSSPASNAARIQPVSSDGVDLAAKTPGTPEPVVSTLSSERKPAPPLAAAQANAIPNSQSVPPLISQAPVPHVLPPTHVEPLIRPAYRRTLPPSTREVFRCASRVFLHSTLSGEHPRVHDIAQAVSDTCGALRELGLSYLPPGTKPSPTDDLRFPVVRGLPFCIFIAGSVAGNMEQGMFLRSCLRPVVREVDMQTAELLTAVLSERAGSGDVSWQSIMVKRGTRPVFM